MNSFVFKYSSIALMFISKPKFFGGQMIKCAYCCSMEVLSCYYSCESSCGHAQFKLFSSSFSVYINCFSIYTISLKKKKKSAVEGWFAHHANDVQLMNLMQLHRKVTMTYFSFFFPLKNLFFLFALFLLFHENLQDGLIIISFPRFRIPPSDAAT